MTNQVLSREATQEKIKEGVDLVADAVKVTLGKGGMNVLLIRDNLLPIITKDGISVAKEISHEDPFVNAGCMMVKEVSSKTNDLAGDGTSTSAVLAQALINEAYEVMKTSKINPIRLQKDLETSCQEVVKHLKKLSKPLKSSSKLRSIANISSNGDKEITDLVIKAINSAGRKGIITVEEDEDKEESQVEIINGYQVDSPFYNAGFITDHSKFTAEYKDMFIVLYDGHLESMDDLTQVVNSVTTIQAVEIEGEQVNVPEIGNLLIMANNIDPHLENDLLTVSANGFKILVVKSPSHGMERTDILNDIAIITGGEVFHKEKKPLTSATKDKLGFAKSVISDVNKTLIISESRDISERIDIVKEQLKNYVGSTKQKDNIKTRLGKLEGGVAIIKVAGKTTTERREKTDRVEDALRAVQSCIDEGYVSGGGSTYLKISSLLSGDNEATKIMKKVLQAPFLQVYKNAGIEVNDKITHLQEVGYGIGIDIDTAAETDLFKIGVIDPTKVARLSIENATSVAGVFITLGASSYNGESIIKMQNYGG